MEMLVVISVLGVLLGIVSDVYRSYIRNSTAAAVGEQMLVVGKAGDAYIRKYRVDIAASTPIPLPLGGQVANLLQPTTTELTALGLLAVSVSTPYNFDGNTASFVVSVAVTPVGCLPAVCKINQITLLSKPWLRSLETATPVNEEMLNLTLRKMDGRGLISTVASPAALVSLNAAFTLPNPTGVAGLLAYFSGADGGLDPAYVRMGDTRDPSLAGGMTVGGTIPSSLLTLQVNGAANISNSLAIGGTSSFAGASVFNSTATFNSPVTINDDVMLRDPVTGTVCVRILRAGQIDINCAGILNAAAGTFTGPLGVVKIGDTGNAYSIDSTGRIRGQAGFYTALQSVFGDNPNGIRFSGTNFTAQNASGVDQLSVDSLGNMQARTSLASPVVALTNAVSPGAACGSPAAISPAGLVTTAAVTALAPVAGGGLASCVGGIWVQISSVATPGAACTTDGIQAASVTDGRMLTCHNGLFTQMKDLLSSFVMMNTYRVGDGAVVAKPTCGQVGAGLGVPIPILLGQVESSPTASFNRRVDDLNATQWIVTLKDSYGGSLGGTPAADALFQAFCYY